MEWLYDLPAHIRLAKHDLYDTMLGRSKSDYYFSILYGKENLKSQKIREDLFEMGILIKFFSEKDKKPTFYPHPPNFVILQEKFSLRVLKTHKKAIEDLEDLYFESFCKGKDSFLKPRYTYMIAGGCYIGAFTMFFIKKFCKKEAHVTIMYIDTIDFERFRLFVGEDILSKVRIIFGPINKILLRDKFKGIREIEKKYLFKERFVIIDALLINFFNLYDIKHARWMGYITSDKQDIEEGKEKFEALWELAK